MTMGIGKAGDAYVDKQVGENLRRICEERGISAETLASLTGESPAVIERIMAGKFSPDLNLLARLSTALNVSWEALVNGL